MSDHRTKPKTSKRPSPAAHELQPHVPFTGQETSGDSVARARTSDQAVRSAVILGFSRGVRHLDPLKSYPRSLRRDKAGRIALEITLNALEEVGVPKPHFVAGYHVEKVLSEFAGRLSVRFLSDWDRRGAVGGLAQFAECISNDCLILDADFMFHREAFDDSPSAEFQIGVAPVDEANGNGCSETLLWIEEGRLIGVGPRPIGAARPHLLQGMIRVLPGGASKLRSCLRSLTEVDIHQTLSDLIARLHTDGAQIEAKDVSRVCLSLDSERPLARFVLGTKAQTLARLRGVVRRSQILDQVCFTVSEWATAPQRVVRQIQANFTEEQLVVRSSTRSEDGWLSSAAGKFDSVLDVPRRSADELNRAITKVVSSYQLRADAIAHDDENGSGTRSDQILVQPMLQETVAAGVVLTRAPTDQSPYFVINYENSARTDAVTGGKVAELVTHWVFKGAKTAHPDPTVRRVLDGVRELEDLLEYDRLDVEFAIDREGELYILQVRPIAQSGSRLTLADEDVRAERDLARAFTKDIFTRHPLLAGRTTILANMPDWNPAEMIGVCPKPLALSLYQGLITSEVWAEAREACGYHDVRSTPLLMSLAGRPYIDVRTTLNSFLPADVPSDLADKIVDVALARLAAHPEWHDKLEFDVTATFYPLDFPKVYNFFREQGLSVDEFRSFSDSLRRLTEAIVRRGAAPVSEQLAVFEQLRTRRERTMDAYRRGELSPPSAIGLLYADAKRFGVLPFSILARFGFIAIGMLRSLARLGIFSSDEVAAIQNGLPTVAGEVVADAEGVRRGELDVSEFIRRHGHLRPSSYDICSANYRDAATKYFDFAAPSRQPADPAARQMHQIAETLFQSRHDAIDRELRQAGFSIECDRLWDFIRAAVPGRERGKYEFTKNLDAILELSATFLAQYGFDRSDAAYVHVDTILRYAHDAPSSAARTLLEREILVNKKRHSLTQAVKLPPVLRSLDDFDYFREFAHQANYVGTGTVTAPTAILDASMQPPNLTDKIVVLENADPGYDWILSRGIAGLVTKYGGVASHMAIRAAEFGFPAAIGCGESLFEAVRRARVVTLDCPARRIIVVS